ncbi:MAG TPA: hypothetical protein VHR36_10715 [Pyrinomonadaceae bacterium]|jgi:phosphate-selective porin|nr:hypothetical protein [Pyrinomonadaceae bacterium]
MKTIKAFCTAIILSLAISTSAFAGDIATPGAALTGDTTTGTLLTTTSDQSTDDTNIGDLDASTLGDVLLTLLSTF